MSSLDELKASGWSAMRLLYQTRSWRDQQGCVHALESMEARYLLNVRHWLFRRAEGLFFAVDAAAALSPWAHDDTPLLSDDYESGAAWLAETPLIGRIDELLEVDGYACVMAATNPEAIHG